MNIFNKTYALSFDGRNDFIEIQSLASKDLENGFSLECWLEPAWDLNPKSKISLFSNLGGNLNIALLPIKEKSELTMRSIEIALGTETFATELSVEPGLWTHLAIVFNPKESSELQLYLNGLPMASYKLSNLPKWSKGSLFFGKGAGPEAPFEGLLAQMALWAGPRTPEQIDEDMYSAPDFQNPNLLGWWKLELSEEAPETLNNSADSGLEAAGISSLCWNKNPSLPQALPESGDLGLIRKKLKDYKAKCLQNIENEAEKSLEQQQQLANASIAQANQQATDLVTRKGLEWIYLINRGKAYRIDPKSGAMHCILQDPIRSLVVDKASNKLITSNWGQTGDFKVERHSLHPPEAYFLHNAAGDSFENEKSFRSMVDWNPPELIENQPPEKALTLLKENYQSQVLLGNVILTTDVGLSFSAWIKFQTSGGIIEGPFNWQINIQPDKTTWELTDKNVIFEVDFPIDVWVNVAVTYDNSDFSFFLNGIPVHTLTLPDWRWNGKFHANGRTNGPQLSTLKKGAANYMQEARLWGWCLEPFEVYSLMYGLQPDLPRVAPNWPKINTERVYPNNLKKGTAVSASENLLEITNGDAPSNWEAVDFEGRPAKLLWETQAARPHYRFTSKNIYSRISGQKGNNVYLPSFGEMVELEESTYTAWVFWDKEIDFKRLKNAPTFSSLFQWTGDFSVWLDREKGLLSIDESDDPALPQILLAPWKWTHIAVTRKGNQIRVYQNGELVLEIIKKLYGRANIGDPIQVLAQFSGFLAEISLWNFQLNSDQVQTQMKGKLPIDLGARQYSLGYWPLSDENPVGEKAPNYLRNLAQDLPYNIDYADKDVFKTDKPISGLIFNAESNTFFYLENNQIYKRPYNAEAKALGTVIGASDLQDFSLALDEENDNLYWSELGAIWRLKDHKSEANWKEMVLSQSEAGDPVDLTFDSKNQDLYWVDRMNKSIRKYGKGNFATLALSKENHIEIPYKRYFKPGEWTFEFWLNIDSVGPAPKGSVNLLEQIGIAGKFSVLRCYFDQMSGNVRVEFQGTDGKRYQLDNSKKDNPEAGSLEVISLETWTHFALSIGETESVFYVNGKEADKIDTEGSLQLLKSSFILGGNGKDSPSFSGALAEFRMWNHARSRDEIESSYAHRLTGSEWGLAGYWPLDEGMNSDLFDLSPQGNTAALNGNPVWIEDGTLIIHSQIKELFPIRQARKGIALDLHTGQIYWADQDERGVAVLMRGNMNGRGKPEVAYELPSDGNITLVSVESENQAKIWRAQYLIKKAHEDQKRAKAETKTRLNEKLRVAESQKAKDISEAKARQQKAQKKKNLQITKSNKLKLEKEKLLQAKIQETTLEKKAQFINFKETKGALSKLEKDAISNGVEELKRALPLAKNSLNVVMAQFRSVSQTIKQLNAVMDPLKSFMKSDEFTQLKEVDLDQPKTEVELDEILTQFSRRGAFVRKLKH